MKICRMCVNYYIIIYRITFTFIYLYIMGYIDYIAGIVLLFALFIFINNWNIEAWTTVACTMYILSFIIKK